MGEPGEGFIGDHEEGIAGVRILGPPMPPSGNGVRSVDLAGSETVHGSSAKRCNVRNKTLYEEANPPSQGRVLDLLFSVLDGRNAAGAV